MPRTTSFPPFPPSAEEYQALLEEMRQCQELVDTISRDPINTAAESHFYEKALEAMVKLAARRFASIQDTIDAYLELGQQLFQLETGILSKVEGNAYEIMALATPNEQLAVGQQFDLKDTLCHFLVEREETFFIPHISHSPQNQHPAHENLHLESYIGTLVRKSGKVYGTLNFSSVEVMEPLFVEKKVQVLQLMGTKLGKLLEQQELEREIRTSREELEISELRFRTLSEEAPVGITLSRRNRELLYVNPCFARIVGYSLEELDHVDWSQLTYEEDRGQNLDLFNRLFDEELPSISFEKRYVHKQGHLIWCRLLVAKAWDREAGDWLLTTVIQDIQQEKTLQEALLAKSSDLQELNHRLTSIHLLTPGTIYLYSLPEQRNLFANRSLFSILGYSEAEIQTLGEGFLFEILHPEDMPAVLHHHQEVLPNLEIGQEVELEYRVQHKDQQHYVWLRSIETGYQWNDEGKVIVSLGLAQDITQRKAQALALQEANEEQAAINEELRTIQEELLRQQQSTLQLNQQLLLQGELLQAGEAISLTGSFEVNSNKQRVIVSKGFLQIYELERREWDQAKFDQMISQRSHPEDHSSIKENIEWNRTHPEAPKSIIHRLQLPSGTLKWVEVAVEESGQPGKLIGAVKDITEIKAQELALVRARDELASLNYELTLQKEFLKTGESIAQTGTWMWNYQTDEFQYSDGWLNICELEASEISPATAMAYIRQHTHPEDVAGLKRDMEHMVTQRSDAPFEQRLVLPSGNVKWVRVKPNRFIGEDRILGAVTDVTHFKIQQRALEKVNYQLQQITNLSPAIIYVYDRVQQTNTFMSQNIEEWLGYPRDHFWGEVSERFTALIPEEDLPELRRHYEAEIPALKDGESAALTHRFQKADGSIVWVRSLNTPFQRDEAGNITAILGISSDVTVEIKAQQALQAANENLAATNEELQVIQEELIANQEQILAANELLEKRESLLQAGEKTAKLGTWIWHVEDDRLEYTSGLLDIFGFDPSKVSETTLAAQIFERVHPHDQHLIIESNERAVANNEGWAIQYRIFPREGEMRWVKASAPIWLDKTRLLGVTLDITERKLVEQSLQELNEELAVTNEELRISQEELLSYQDQLQTKNRLLEEQQLLMTQGEEVAKLGAWILDSHNLTTEFSKGFIKVHGFEEEEVNPMNALQLCKERIHSSDQERVSEALENLPNQSLPFELVYRFTIPGKAPIWLRDIVGHRLADGRFVGTSQDITLQKEQELELIATQKELEQMIYSISHDLRAPIRHINGYSNMVLEESETMEADQRNRLQRVVKASERLGNLIDELLQYSRGRRKVFQPQEVNVQRMVANLIQFYDPSPTLWEVNALPTIQADVEMLERILQNLIENAVKFTSKKEQPEISISASWREKEQDWLFAVIDNGAGFDMRFANKLFAVFQRLHLHDEFPGTGIGLATVQRFVQMHGGKIWAEGVVNEGAKFYFTIPQ